MVAPIIWGLIALGMAACAASIEETRRENPSPEGGPQPPSSEPPQVSPPNVDPCPEHFNCSCAEGTGWVSGLPTVLDDNYIQIGSRTIDTRKEIFSVKNPPNRFWSVSTSFPLIDFQFKLGSDEPQDPALFQRQTAHLTNELLKIVLGKYPCVSVIRGTGEPIVYISGHTDRLAGEEFNLSLSRGRALRVAQGVRQWLEVHRSELKTPVIIKYVGLGEKWAAELGDVDETTNEKARRVEVIASTEGPPFEADWQVLGRVEPGGFLEAPPLRWQTSVSRSVQNKVRAACREQGIKDMERCVDWVASRMIAGGSQTCARHATTDNISLEVCQKRLFGFVWHGSYELKMRWGKNMPHVVADFSGPNPLKASNGTTHDGLATFIEYEAKLYRQQE